MKMKIVTGLLIGLTLLSLSGCKDKELSPQEAREELKNAQTEIALSEAISEKRIIWYYASDRNIEKNTDIKSVYVFENGKATYYDDLYNLTFKQLDGLSDIEIIELVKEVDATSNDLKITTELENAKFNENSVKSEAEAITEIKEKLVPKSSEFQLKIKTDGTGYRTKEESVVFEYVDFYTLEICKGTLHINGISGMFTIYDKQYGGYLSGTNGVFLTKIDNVNTIFVFDKPNTKGIETD